jgi:endonuclease VIII
MTGMAPSLVGGGPWRIGRRAVDGGVAGGCRINRSVDHRGRRYGRGVPEGDTVYLAGKRLRAALSGRTLLRGELRHPRLAEQDLTGRTVLDVASVGKHLLTRFDDGRTLHTHFRMDGSWHLYRPGMSWQRPVHEARAVLETDDRVAVGFLLHDMELVPTAQEDRLVGHLGPDLLDPDWSDAHAAEALRRFTARGASELGLVLLEQRVMAGVGNLYKAEVCFLLGLSPWTLVRDVPDPAAAIALSRKLLLRNADRPEQSTTGELGRGRQHWVFERAGQRCRRCGTRIRTAEQGDGVYARIAYWCPRCQPGPGPAVSSRAAPR